MTTVVLNIENGSFPSVKIPPGTSIAWQNRDRVPHSAETLRGADFYFNAGALLPGRTSSAIEFPNAGEFPYLCRFHHGMTGAVRVAPGPIEVDPPSGGHNHHLKHFHGFVTGGRSASRLFMSHTPILADPRHHFQILLRGSLIEQNAIDAYDALRNSAYGDGKVQVFHDHLSLPDIGNGTITELPSASLVYYPSGSRGADVPGLEDTSVRVRIDEVLYFHTFDKDAPYPEGLEYIVYGDSQDVFIDHAIDRAPGFHSVAKLASAPAFWAGSGIQRVLLPGKKIRDLPPLVLERGALVDNAFHLFWLPPAGLLRPTPQDPLIQRNGSAPIYEVVLQDRSTASIEISRFLHFDFKLLNYGVLITS